MKKWIVSLECTDIVNMEIEAESKEEAVEEAQSQARGMVFGDSFELLEIDEIKS